MPDHQKGDISELELCKTDEKADENPSQALIDFDGSDHPHCSHLPVPLIIFLAAPHKGLQTNALETLVKSKPTEDLIRELKPGSPTLTDLNRRFAIVAKDIEILTCYELYPTKTAIQVSSIIYIHESL